MNKFVVMQYVEELAVHILFQAIFRQNEIYAYFLPQTRHHIGTITSSIQKLIKQKKTLNDVQNDAKPMLIQNFMKAALILTFHNEAIRANAFDTLDAAAAVLDGLRGQWCH